MDNFGDIADDSEGTHDCNGVILIHQYNVGFFEEPEPFITTSLPATDAATTIPSSPATTIRSLPQPTPPLNQSAILPSSSCSHHSLQTDDQSTATVTSTNAGRQWELEQSTKCSKFLEDTCGCKGADGKPCSSLFTEEYYITFRAQASFLTREQLDLVLLGSVMSAVSDGEVSAGRHKPAKCQRTAVTYMHKGHHVCRSTFNFLYGVGKHHVPAIKKNFREHGLETRVHGNTRIRPLNTLSWVIVMNTVKFICNYAEQNAILLPGRIPSHKRDGIKLLPSSDSKKVHNGCCEEREDRHI